MHPKQNQPKRNKAEEPVASAHHLDPPMVRVSRRNERNIMMNQTDWGMMNGWWGGMWMVGGLGVVIAVLLIVVIGKLSKK